MVTIYGMLGPFDDGLADEVRRLKVHVGHPHGQHIGVAEDLLAQVVFNAVGISAIDDLVEIVFHHFSAICDAKVQKIFAQKEKERGKCVLLQRQKRHQFYNIKGESHSGNCNRL